MFVLITTICGFSAWECEFVEKVSARYAHVSDLNKVKLIKEVYNFEADSINHKAGYYEVGKFVNRADKDIYNTASEALQAGRDFVEKSILDLEKNQLINAEYAYREYKKLSCTAYTETKMRDLYHYCDGQST